MPRARSTSSGRGSGSMFGSAPSRSAAPAHHAPAAPAKPAAPVPAAPAPHAPAVAPAAPAPQVVQVAPSGGGGGFFSTMMSGMAFGTGSAIAHRAVGAVAESLTGGDKPKEAAAAAPAAAAPAAAAAAAAPSDRFDCSPFQRELTACIRDYKDDISRCQVYVTQLDQCQKDARLA